MVFSGELLGWTRFFKAAGLEGKMPSIVRGQGRQQTFDLFSTAAANPRVGVLPLLLVDSEETVAEGHSVWQHLEALVDWRRPRGAAEDQAFLMVQVMETWFLADRDLLRRYFGSALRENHLRQWPNLEGVELRLEPAQRPLNPGHKPASFANRSMSSSISLRLGHLS